MAKEIVTFDRPTAEALVGMLGRDVPDHNNTPHGRRHRWVSACSCTPPVVGKATTTITARSGTTSGSGTVAFQVLDGGTYSATGTTATVSNPALEPFATDEYVLLGWDGSTYVVTGTPSAVTTDETSVIEALDGATITTATVSGSDKVLVQDADDSDNVKTVTADSIAALVSADECYIMNDSSTIKHSRPYDAGTIATCDTFHYVHVVAGSVTDICYMLFDDAGHYIGFTGQTTSWASPWSEHSTEPT